MFTRLRRDLSFSQRCFLVGLFPAAVFSPAHPRYLIPVGALAVILP